MNAAESPTGEFSTISLSGQLKNSKSEGVLCVCLETERVVSGCERCETEMAKANEDKKKRNDRDVSMVQ